MLESYTAVVERNVRAGADFVTEPYECAWAREAIFFLRSLEGPLAERMDFVVQISPDGIRWLDDGPASRIPAGAEAGFVKATHFGGWLRLRRTDGGTTAPKLIVHLNLK